MSSNYLAVMLCTCLAFLNLACTYGCRADSAVSGVAQAPNNAAAANLPAVQQGNAQTPTAQPAAKVAAQPPTNAAAAQAPTTNAAQAPTKSAAQAPTTNAAQAPTTNAAQAPTNAAAANKVAAPTPANDAAAQAPKAAAPGPGGSASAPTPSAPTPGEDTLQEHLSPLPEPEPWWQCKYHCGSQVCFCSA